MRRSIRSLIKELICCSLSLLVMASATAQTPDIETEVLQRLDYLRTIVATTDKDRLAEYNQQLDEAWTFFKETQENVLPILVRELKAEREKPRPNDLFLMDVGYLLYLGAEDDSLYREEAKQALFAVDPDDEVVTANQQQLFEFVYEVAIEQDPRALALIDRAFLFNNTRQAVIPQHSVTLDGTIICVYLYGLYGSKAEEHLGPLLQKPEVAQKVMEILIWLGSEKSVEAVNQALALEQDFETFTRAIAFMMQAGGPVGKAKILEIRPDDYDSAAQQYYAQVKGSVDQISFDMMKRRFSRNPGVDSLPAEELKKLFAEMYKNLGKNSGASPMAILNSDLSKEYLIDQLQRIRSRMFYRITEEALADVKMTNYLINTLRYRSE